MTKSKEPKRHRGGALHAAASLSELILEAAGEGIYGLDAQGLTTFVNPAAARMLGWDPDELLGRPQHDVIHHTRRDGTPYEAECCPIYAAFRDGRERRVTGEVFWRKDGSFFDVEYVSTPIVDEGRLVGAVVLFQDVSDRVAAERQRALFEAVVELAKDVVIVTDAEDVRAEGPRIEYVNPAFTAVTGYTSAEVLGQSPRFLQGPDTDRAEVARLGEAIERREQVRAELINYRKDGTPFAVELNIAPVASEDGHVRHFASIQRETTERRQNEEALQRAQQELEQTLERITDVFVAFDREFRFTYINRSAERLMGLRRDELLGQRIWDRFPETVETEAWHAYHRAIETQEPVAFEYLSPISHRWLAFQVYPSPYGLSVFARDVTHERETLAALRRSELRYRTLFENSLEAMFLTLPGGRIFAANPAACELFGYTEEELIRMGRAGILDLDDPATRRVVAERDRNPQYRGEVEIIRKDGRRIPIEFSTGTYFDETGVGKTALFVRDVTVRKRAQTTAEVLAASGQLLAAGLDERSVVEGLLNIVVPRLAEAALVFLMNGDIESGPCKLAGGRCPEGLEHLIGSELVRGRDFGVLGVLAGGPPFQLDDATRPAAVREEEVCDDEQRGVLASLDLCALLVVPLVARGQTVGALALLRRSRAGPFDAQDEQLAMELAGRTALAMENARLYADQIAAAQLRDDVMAMVSHDLRNPINAMALDVQYLARLLSRQPGREGEKEIASRLGRSVERATRMIADLLDVTAIEAGQLNMVPRPQDVGLLVDEVVRTARPAAAERSIRVRSDVSPDMPRVEIDADRIHQVLGNLLSNAIKFTPPEGEVTVGAAIERDRLHLWVADDGPGIAPEDVPHLFERFWQAQPGRHGVGLGLPIALGIVEAHGGHLDVDTAPGRGTTMHVWLPARGKG